jgi:hypothetical protein
VSQTSRPNHTAYYRLARFRAEHPDVEIISHGFWQARILEERNSEVIVTRWDLHELLNKLEELLPAAPESAN